MKKEKLIYRETIFLKNTFLNFKIGRTLKSVESLNDEFYALKLAPLASTYFIVTVPVLNLHVWIRFCIRNTGTDPDPQSF